MHSWVEHEKVFNLGAILFYNIHVQVKYHR